MKRYVQVSTDEVYGSLGPTGFFTEDDAAAPEQPVFREQGRRRIMLVLAYHHTFGLNAVITRCSNNYGPLPVPREADPAIRHEPAERRTGAGVRRRPCRSATGFTSSTTAAAWKARVEERKVRRGVQLRRPVRKGQHRPDRSCCSTCSAKPETLIRYVAGPPRPRPPVRD